ncbi:MAG TPA: PASTA domain-containing protein [Terriglobia bacterium]|nr:PASTA domain-containing protein [Terriglobia bacterium]
MGIRERIVTLFRLFLLFTVLVAVALISAITTVRLTIHGHQETMPDLVGRPLETGERILSGLGLEVKIEGRMFSAQYPVNQIVSQVPPPGTRIKVGQHVHVLVSLGPPQVKVPNIVGSSARAAQIAAIQRGLSVGDLVAVHFAGSDVDQVMAQEPPASAAVVHSPAVNFLVSLGPEPPAYECPSFEGRPLADVRRFLEEHQFKVGTITSVAKPGVPLNTIVGQTPDAGSRIDADTEFAFQVAGPPPSPIPAAPAAPPPAPPPATTPPSTPH